jgi:hypothetical protein
MIDWREWARSGSLAAPDGSGEKKRRETSSTKMAVYAGYIESGGSNDASRGRSAMSSAEIGGFGNWYPLPNGLGATNRQSHSYG